MRVLLMLLLAAAAATCQAQQPLREVVLPSGKKVKVIAVGRINFTNDSPALMLRYQTDLKVSNVPELRKEVDEIFASFKSEVEHEGLTNAIISANEGPQSATVKKAGVFNFVYRKSADGTWRLAGNADKPAAPK